MKRLMLVAALLAGPALATPASAVQFTLSDAFGTGDFGSATAFFTDATERPSTSTSPWLQTSSSTRDRTGR